MELMEQVILAKYAIRNAKPALIKVATGAVAAIVLIF